MVIQTPNLVSEVTARMVTEFRGLVPGFLVTRLVEHAHDDLSGRIAPEAADEILVRLARYRLTCCQHRLRDAPPTVWDRRLGG